MDEHNILKEKPSIEEFIKLFDTKTNRVTANITVLAGDLISEGGVEDLNDLADEKILPEDVISSLSDLNYTVVGLFPGGSSNYVTGTLIVKVDALVEDSEFLDQIHEAIENNRDVVLRSHDNPPLYYREQGEWVSDWRQASSYTYAEVRDDLPGDLSIDKPVTIVAVDDLIEKEKEQATTG